MTATPGRAPFDAAPPTVLLLDDSPDAALVERAIRDSQLPCRVSRGSTGPCGRAYLLREPPFGDAPRPAFVLLDPRVPGGYELLAEIKGDRQLRTVPVIVMSDSPSDDDVRRAHEAGANAYVLKPSDPRVLAHHVQTLARFWLTVVTLPRR